MIIAGIDPGTTTGVCVVEVLPHFIEVQSVKQLSVTEFFEFLNKIYVNSFCRREQLVIAEQFQVSTRTLKADMKGMHDAFDVLGATEYVCSTNSVKFIRQSPSQGKSLGTDKNVCTVLGLTDEDITHKLRHQIDAARHITAYLMSNANMYPEVLRKCKLSLTTQLETNL